MYYQHWRSNDGPDDRANIAYYALGIRHPLACGYYDLLAFLDFHQVFLINVKINPNSAQISNYENLGSFTYNLS